MLRIYYFLTKGKNKLISQDIVTRYSTLAVVT